MSESEEAALRAALSRLGVAEAAFLGSGGEARVYALDDERVLRITHAGADIEQIRTAIDFVATLRAPVGLALPRTLDLWDQDDRVVTVERRLPGRSLLDHLADAEPGAGRGALIESHLEAGEAIGDMLALSKAGPVDRFGEFLVAEPVTGSSLHEFLSKRAAWSIAEAGPDFPAVAIERLLDGLPDLAEVKAASLVHLDAFAGNMMSDGTRVTAVFDFGGAVVIGAPWMNGVTTAVYLTVPTITPTAIAADVDVARSWLRSRGLADLEDPLRRWLAAYWAFAVGDTTLHRWCRSVFA